VLEIVTTRLRLTPLCSTDFEELADMYADPKVMLGSSGSAMPRSREESLKWLTRTLRTICIERGRATFRVEDRASGTLFGRCGLRPDADTPDTELAYAFAQRFWGQGIATEAANAILDWGSAAGLTKVIAYALASNVASQRVLHKLRMTRSGERSTPNGALYVYELEFLRRLQ
jgi:RimJ/RimL family protein N-acetyltransferase